MISKYRDLVKVNQARACNKETRRVVCSVLRRETIWALRPSPS